MVNIWKWLLAAANDLNKIQCFLDEENGSLATTWPVYSYLDFSFVFKGVL